MFKLIIELLQYDNYYGVSKNIDIAKGMYKKQITIKESLSQIKRIYKSKYKK